MVRYSEVGANQCLAQSPDTGAAVLNVSRRHHREGGVEAGVLLLDGLLWGLRLVLRIEHEPFNF